MFTSFEYTKEFEKILLTDNIEDSLKNLVPNSVQDYFVRFITELKKCKKTKVLSDELKNLFTKIQKEKLPNQFVNDCERTYNLFEYDLPSTTQERKKQIIDYLYRQYSNQRFDAPKPDFASKMTTKTAKEKDNKGYPSELTEEMIKKEITKFIDSKAKEESKKFRFLTKKEQKEKFEELILNKKNKDVLDIIKENPGINYYLLSDNAFNTLVNIFNEAEQNIILTSYLILDQFTLNQLELLMKKLTNTLILDKNSIMSAFINKKYEPELSTMKSDLVGQRKVLISIFNEVKQYNGFNNYLSSTLYQILELGKEINDYDYEFFIEYLKNPMSNSQYNNLFQDNKQIANNTNFYSVNQLSSLQDTFYRINIIDDYIEYFFINKKATTKNFDKYLSSHYLEREYFKAEILRGDDVKYNPSTHAQYISKDEYESLCKKVEITICEHNKKNFAIDEDVTIDFDIKNVNNLSISIYEINTENYYLNKKQAITSLIVVEGLITDWESNYAFNEKSQVRCRKTITLEKIPKKRGVYLVEILGNGISSRIIIKKGSLSLVTRSTPKGKLCYIVNEKNEICKGDNTYIWYNGRKLQSEKERGMILIPYASPFASSTPDSYCILNHEGFSDFANVTLENENYQLKGTFYMNHESLITGNMAKVVFKPMLLVNGREINVKELKNGKITVNISKIENEKIVPIDNTIENVVFDKESEFEFEVQIPPMIAGLSFTYTGDITKNSTKKTETLSVFQSESINTNKEDIFNYFVRKTIKNKKDNYIVELVGRNGESGASVPTLIMLRSKENSLRECTFTLQTNEKGIIELGDLNEFDRLIVKRLAAPQLQKTFLIEKIAKYSYPETIDGVAGEAFTIPYYTQLSFTDFVANICLLKEEKGNVISIMNSKEYLSFTPMNINGDDKHYYDITITNLPIGQYKLKLNPLSNKDTVISIHIHHGEKWIDSNFIINPKQNKLIENSQEINPIHITKLDINKETKKINITTNSLSPNQHIELFMYQYIPQGVFKLFDKIESMYFDNVELNTEQPFQEWKNIYLSNRTLNEEIQYVLERKNYEAKMGNSLEMPSLLLKRAFTKQSEIEEESLAKGSRYQKKDAEAQDKLTKKTAQKEHIQTDDSISLFQNFISNVGVSMFNIKPKKDNIYEIDINNMNYSHLVLVVVDDKSTSSNLITLADEGYEVAKRAMTNDSILDNAKNVTEIRKLQNKLKDEKFIISENSNFKLIDSIEKVLKFNLLKSPSFNGEWKDFEFLMDAKTDEKKFLENLSKNISHEVNIFLYFKYPDLFEKYVKPLLKYKFEKTFIDYFLLDDMETLQMYLKPEKLNSLNTFQLCLLIIKFVNTNPDLAKKIRNLIKVKIPTDCFDNVDSVIRENFDIMMYIKQEKDSEIPQEVESCSEGEKEEQDKCVEEELQEDDDLDICPQQAPVNSNATYGGGFRGVRGRPFPAPAAPGMALQKQMLMPQMCQMDMVSNSIQSRAMPSMSNNCFALQTQMPQTQFRMTRSMMTQSQCMDNNLFMGAGYQRSYKQAAQIAEKNQIEFEKPGTAKEYKERHYLKSSHSNPCNSILFLDFADHLIKTKSVKNFVSKYILDNSKNIDELVWQLSIIDLPLKSVKHGYKRIPNRQIEITPASNLVLLTKEISEGKLMLDNKLLISQNVSDLRENVDVTNLVKGAIYSHETIVTNISSNKVQFDLFVQIPEGAIPMKGSFYTQTHHMTLEPYITDSYKTWFYFPKVGTFKQYHPIATKDTDIISIGGSLTYTVKDIITFIKKKEDDDTKEKKLYDPMKLKEIMANGDTKDILNYFRNENFISSELYSILWLLKDKEFFLEITSILRSKGIFNISIWAYGFYHYDEKTISEYLNSKKDIKRQLNSDFKSSLIETNEIDEPSLFPYLEYSPLYNARVHPLGKAESHIQNKEFKDTYQKFVVHCLTLESLSVKYLLRLTYYLILQERIDEATRLFEKIDKASIKGDNNSSYEIQYDYLNAYLDLSNGYPNFAIAKEVCVKYKNFPLLYWREKFEEIEDILFEYEGKETVTMLDVENTTQSEKQLRKELKNTQPSLSFTIDKTNLVIVHTNISKINIKFYLIDLEILFSRTPSLKSNSNDFSFVQPNFSHELKVENSTSEAITKFEIPKEYTTKNIFIELSTGSIKQFETYFSANLNVIINENIGELKVLNSDLKPVIKAYVKCFAKVGGSNQFYKDGYTDLRGKFNYLALNTDQLKNASMFYIFVSDDDLGSMIKECRPPYNLEKGDNSYEGVLKYKQQQRTQWRVLNKK